MKFNVNIYRTVTEWIGDEDPNGYEQETEDISPEHPLTLRELVDNLVYGGYYELSCYPARGNSRNIWASTETQQDYRTGEYSQDTLHFSNLDGTPVNERNTRRIYRLAGLIK